MEEAVIGCARPIGRNPCIAKDAVYGHSAETSPTWDLQGNCGVRIRVSRTTIFRITVALVFASGLLWSSNVVAEEPSAAAAMVQAGRAPGVPVGIVLRNGNDLCRKPSVLLEKRSEDPMQHLRQLGHAYGYRVDTSAPVGLVMPRLEHGAPGETTKKLLQDTCQ